MNAQEFKSIVERYTSYPLAIEVEKSGFVATFSNAQIQLAISWSEGAWIIEYRIGGKLFTHWGSQLVPLNQLKPGKYHQFVL